VLIERHRCRNSARNASLELMYTVFAEKNEFLESFCVWIVKNYVANNLAWHNWCLHCYSGAVVIDSACRIKTIVSSMFYSGMTHIWSFRGAANLKITKV